MSWRIVFVLLVGSIWAGCGELGRENPADPLGGDQGSQEGIDLVALLPQTGKGGVADLLAEIRYHVSGEDLPQPLEGRMDLVGRTARARVVGVPPGGDRVFEVRAYDLTEVMTFAAVDTVEVVEGGELTVELELVRLSGSLELTSNLPPEVTELEIHIDAHGDTLLLHYPLEGPLTERIGGIPTRGDVDVVLLGYDADRQIVVQKSLNTDIRDDLVARISLEAVGGFLQIVAHFSEYIPIVEIDRFNDQVATFFRRSENPDLPGPNEPIDFDDPRFNKKAFGPDGEIIKFYNFDVRPREPAIVYMPVDRRGDQLVGQLPIFDRIPGEEGYSDFWHINQVRVIDPEYRPNALSDAQAVLDSGWEITPTETLMQAVMVPDHSKADLRFDPATSSDLLNGWYQGKVVKYFLFAHPASSAMIDFGSGQINTPQMYGFFANDRDEKDGFEFDLETEMTHNVATRLPGEEGYSPLWVLQVFKLTVFDRVQDLASALDQSSNEETTLPLEQLLYLNAPIVQVGESGSELESEPGSEPESEPVGEDGSENGG